jgi:Fe-S-cluster containining protein
MRENFMSTKSERQDNFLIVCKNCNDIDCCRNARPPISAKRRKIIEAYLKQNKVHIKNPFVAKAYTFPREHAEGYCIFLDEATLKCKVHSVKPETCVAGPITFDIKNGKIEWFLKKDTICMLAGKLHEDGNRFEKHFEAAKSEILSLVHELDSEALQAILKIAEPETIKIDEDNIDNQLSNKLKC